MGESNMGTSGTKERRRERRAPADGERQERERALVDGDR